MLPDDLRKAVEAMDGCVSTLPDMNRRHWSAIKAHLLAREAEVERLTELAARDDTAFQAIRDAANGWMAKAKDAQARAERDDALLREVVPLLHPDTDEHKRITAHLSENSRG